MLRHPPMGYLYLSLYFRYIRVDCYEPSYKMVSSIRRNLQWHMAFQNFRVGKLYADSLDRQSGRAQTSRNFCHL